MSSNKLIDNIYTPKSYRLYNHDINILTLFMTAYSKYSKALNELYDKYIDESSLFDKHQGISNLTKLQLTNLNYINKLANTNLFKKIYTNFNNNEFANNVERLALEPEYLISYYIYLLNSVMDSFIKYSKFFNEKEKNNLKTLLIKNIAEDINSNNVITKVDNFIYDITGYILAVY